MLTISDGSSGPSTIQDDNRCRIQDDGGFNWNKYIKEDEELKALVAEFKQSREEEQARGYLRKEYKKYREARWANRWNEEKECCVDPEGNLTTDPDEVDFKVLVAAIPTVGVW
ncbi:hypothetical protein Hanom_Chr05g00412311 [Helianthus anomalus]